MCNKWGVRCCLGSPGEGSRVCCSPGFRGPMWKGRGLWTVSKDHRKKDFPSGLWQNLPATRGQHFWLLRGPGARTPQDS